MTIELADQYNVEKQRNKTFLALSLLLDLLLPLIHGFLFLWIPWILRSHRNQESLRFVPYFNFMKFTSRLTKTFSTKIFNKKLYFQPSLLIVAAIHLALNAFFCVAQTDEINYEPKSYIISKRLGAITVAQVLPILLFVSKNNVVSTLSGLSSDKSVFFHKWLGRFAFLSATLHMSLSLKYWICLKFNAMLRVPPQIFGFIAFSCLGMMNLGSLKLIRKFSFELFMIQHRIFNFIFLLLTYFHNPATHLALLVGIHLFVLDRITCRVLGILHKRKNPTKGKCDFEILDENTTRVTIPITISNCDSHKWWRCFVPRYGSCRAGQHVLFNCNKVALLAYHPFTIASLPSSGSMVLVIRKKDGFTKQLHKKLETIALQKDKECDIIIQELSSQGSEKNMSVSKDVKVQDFETPRMSESSLRCLLSRNSTTEIFSMKAGINGPFGGAYQPLIKFETVVFFSAGSGASFTLPVALELLRELKFRDLADDYLYRPRSCIVSINVVMRKRANTKWYNHLWEEFYPYLDSEKALLNFYFTGADKKDDSDLDLVKFCDAHKGSSLLLMTRGGILVTYLRPAIEDIVTTHATKLNSAKKRQSIACLGCGPVDFNYVIEQACQKNRKQIDAPDIYFYKETFE